MPKSIPLRIEDSLYIELSAAAKKSGLSMNEIMSAALVEKLKEIPPEARLPLVKKKPGRKKNASKT